jgi:hypothetical protein
VGPAGENAGQNAGKKLPAKNADMSPPQSSTQRVPIGRCVSKLAGS